MTEGGLAPAFAGMSGVLETRKLEDGDPETLQAHFREVLARRRPILSSRVDWFCPTPLPSGHGPTRAADVAAPRPAGVPRGHRRPSSEPHAGRRRGQGGDPR